MTILKADKGKVYLSLIDPNVYATTIYLADNDSKSNYKLIDESEVIMTTESLEEDDKFKMTDNNELILLKDLPSLFN